MRSSVIAVVLGLWMTGCGSSADTGSGGGSSHGHDCTSLCDEAQSRSCTSVHGDCGNFCAAVASVSSAASCGSKHDAYESCLGDGDVCTGDDRCASEKSALENCAAAYCQAHASDADCATVVNSL